MSLIYQVHVLLFIFQRYLAVTGFFAFIIFLWTESSFLFFLVSFVWPILYLPLSLLSFVLYLLFSAVLSFVPCLALIIWFHFSYLTSSWVLFLFLSYSLSLLFLTSTDSFVFLFCGFLDKKFIVLHSLFLGYFPLPRLCFVANLFVIFAFLM